MSIYTNNNNNKTKEIYRGGVKMKEVYKGSQLVWRGVKPADPIILFEANKTNLGFEQGFTYLAGGGYVAISASNLYISQSSNGTLSIVSSQGYDVTGHKTLRVNLINTGQTQGVGITLVSNKYDEPGYPWTYSSVVGTPVTLDFDISSISGMKYINISSIQYSGLNIYVTITKVELI